MEYIYHYSSPLGGILLSGNDTSLTGLWFDGQKYYADTLTGPREERLTPVFEQTLDWLQIYFSGQDPAFLPPLSPRGTPFRKEVWDVLLTIPYGQTRTYGEIASVIAARRGLPYIQADKTRRAAFFILLSVRLLTVFDDFSHCRRNMRGSIR